MLRPPTGTIRPHKNDPVGSVLFRLLVGLGNPGARYRGTRHNVGFDIVERLVDSTRAAWRWASSEAVAADAVIDGVSVTLMKPLTYMNLSGRAVGAFADAHALDPAEILVYFDDVALSLGRIRIRERGRAGGHRGLESVIEALGSEDVPRVRFGVGTETPPENLAEFVLQPFTDQERPRLEKTLGIAVEATSAILNEGMAKAMSRYNAVVV